MFVRLEHSSIPQRASSRRAQHVRLRLDIAARPRCSPRTPQRRIAFLVRKSVEPTPADRRTRTNAVSGSRSASPASRLTSSRETRSLLERTPRRRRTVLRARRATPPSSVWRSGRRTSRPRRCRFRRYAAESSIVASEIDPRFRATTSARVSRADAGYAAESSVVASVKSTLVSARRLPRASATPTPRPRARARARRRRPGWSPCRMRADGVALRPQRDAKRVATSAATNPV